MKIIIESIHFTADQKLLDLINKKVERLSKFYDRIIEAEVYLKLENSGQIKDKIVEIKLFVPGPTLFAKGVDKTFEKALDEATSNLRRQMIRFKEQRRAH